MSLISKTLDGTVDSVVRVSRELASMPKLVQGFTTFGLSRTDVKSEDLSTLISQFGTLSERERSAAMSLLNLNSVQKQAIQTNLQAFTSGDKLNAKVLEQQINLTSLSEAQQKSIMTEAGLIDSAGKYHIQMTQNASANIKATATYQALNAEQQAEITSAMDATVAQQAHTGAVVQATAAQSAYNIALAIGKQLLLGLAVGAVIYGFQYLVKVIDNLIVTYDELVEKAEQAKSEYDEESQKVEDLTTKLEELRQKKEELAGTSSTSDDELAKIERQIVATEAELKLAQELAAQKARDANNAAVGVATSNTHVSRYQNGSVGITNTEYLKEQIKYYGDLDTQLQQLEKSYSELIDTKNSYPEDSNEYKAYEKASNELQTQIDSVKESMVSAKDTIVGTYNEINSNYKTVVQDGSDAANQVVSDWEDATDSFVGFENQYSDTTDKIEDSSNAAADATKYVAKTAEEVSEIWDKLNSKIDSLQSAYSNLNNVVEEYNQYGAISVDTLQGVLDMDSKYLACLVNENGQLEINMQTFQAIAEARLNDAKTAAVEQAMTELAAIANQEEEATAIGSMTTLANKGAVVEALAGQYKYLGDWAGYAAKAEALADAYSGAAAVNVAAANEVMSGLNAKLALIDSTMSAIQSSATGAGAALGGFSNASKNAANGAKELTKALEEQKKAIEAEQEALQKEQNRLRIYAQAAIKELEKRISALKEQKEAQDDVYDDQIDKLKEEIDKLKEAQETQEKLYDKQIEALKEKKEALQKANDEEDRAIKLAELQEALARAKSQRTKRVYSHEGGFQWQVDDEAVRNAQNNLDDQQRTWKREDEIQAIEDEIDAIENLKDKLKEETDKKIEAIEKSIEIIEKEKEAYDKSIEKQIEDIEKLKDTYNDTLSLIGTSWEDYQLQLEAAAMFSGMTLEQMADYHAGFKDSVIGNMQEIYDADLRMAEIEAQLSAANEQLNNSSSGAAAGLGNLASASVGTKAELENLLAKIKENGDELNTLKEKEAQLKDTLAGLTEGTSAHFHVLDQLGVVQDDIADKTTILDGLTAEYIETVAAETEATEEDRDTQIRTITDLMDKYGISYEAIATTLEEYVENVSSTTETNTKQYQVMVDTMTQFAVVAAEKMGAAEVSIDKLSGTIETDMSKSCNAVQSLIDKLNDLIKKLAEAKEAKANSNVVGAAAAGMRTVRKAGSYHVDENGKELIVRTSGRVVSLEHGDSVVPAWITKNLWEQGTHPDEMFDRQMQRWNRENSSLGTVQNIGGDTYDTSVGDIIIQNPVGNSDDLAKDLIRRFPNAMIRASSKR